MLAIFKNILGVNKEKEVKRTCGNCEYQHDVDNCPNSFYCYSREDKPYFKHKNDKNLKQY